MQWLFESFRHTLENQIVSGGIFLVIITSLVAFSRNLPTQFWGWLKRQIIISADIINSDPLFGCFELFLDHHPYSLRCRTLTAQMKHVEEEAARASTPNAHGRAAARIMLTPAPGHHVFKHRGHWVWLWRVRKDKIEAATEQLRGPVIEYFHIRMFGRRQAKMRELLEAARLCAVEATRGRCQIFASNYGQWVHIPKQHLRTFESIILPAGVLDALVRDVREFLSSRPWYAAHGIPYRHNFLFYGVMGSGKSSIVEAIGNELNLNIYILNVAGAMMSDERVHELLIAIPPDSIVLIEEIDAAVCGETITAADYSSKVTFQGLLQALDGLSAREGCMIFMTTNHFERLNPRLIRDGRVDYRLEFRPATEEQCGRVFRRFYPGACHEQARRFAAALAPQSVPMSTVQKILIDHKGDPTGALAAAGAPTLPLTAVTEREEVAAA